MARAHTDEKTQEENAKQWLSQDPQLRKTLDLKTTCAPRIIPEPKLSLSDREGVYFQTPDGRVGKPLGFLEPAILLKIPTGLVICNFQPYRGNEK